MTTRTTLIAAVVLASACGSSSINGDRPDGAIVTVDAPLVDARAIDGGSSVGCLPGLDTLALNPPSVNMTGPIPAEILFAATARYGDGHTESVPADRLTWTAQRADDVPPGTIAAGRYVPNSSAGGVITISASDGCKSASATVTLTMTGTIGTPAGVGWGGTPTTMGEAVPYRSA